MCWFSLSRYIQHVQVESVFFMQQNLSLEPWSISTSSNTEDSFTESIFFTGNGRMGARAYMPFFQEKRSAEIGLFVAGIFGEIKPGITDFVNLPTPIWADIECNKQHMIFNSPIQTQLDFKTGLRTQTYTARNNGISLSIEHQMFFSMADPSLLVQRYNITASNSAKISLSLGLNTACCNCPVPDDQLKENHETVQLSILKATSTNENNINCCFTIQGTNLKVNEEIVFHAPIASSNSHTDSNVIAKNWNFSISSRQQVVFEACTRVSTSRDIDTRIGSNKINDSFSNLLANSAKVWSDLWKRSDIEITGSSNDQSALRYNIFQSIANCSANDSTVSIGARGLTHTRYKGCYFWDTDFFMLPFYIFTQPKAAKSLMEYRVNTLSQAKDHAKKMNSAGARYPWMTSFDGTEQCETWDIGASELHVTADIVFAMQQYIAYSGDMNFYKEATEVFIETARFWASRCTKQADGSADILFCKGPDEYCGITNNNLFTNYMVKNNLELACKVANELKVTRKEAYQALNLSDTEIENWLQLSKNLRVCRDSQTGHLLPDETFARLEPIDLGKLKFGDEASYHNVSFDRLQRYKVIKQADTLLLMSRMPQKFTKEERLQAWLDFEPLCLHDSTLSFASHALFAAQNNLSDAANNYWQKALYLDLHDIMHNTGKEGLHLACIGETWSTLFFGFLGAKFDGDKISFSPNLPRNWENVKLNFNFHNKRYSLLASNKQWELREI